MPTKPRAETSAPDSAERTARPKAADTGSNADAHSGTPDFPFPILTQDVAATGKGDTATDPSVAATRQLSDALGWRWRPDDPKAFLAALSGSFSISRVEGHNEVTWTPRGFAVQADLGAVTGGQASLAARVRSTVRETLPLLDALVPLLPDADPEDCAAFRGLARHDLEELRYELASPVLREQRIDLLFRTLTGYDPLVGFSAEEFDASVVGGHLGRIRDKFGFLLSDKRTVNTLDEERIETTFVTLSDWVTGLVMSWDAQRTQLDVFKGSGVYLGNTLTVLGGQLSALHDLVDDVESALDSVLIDEGQRQAIRVPGTTLFVDGLLNWVRTFADSEGKTVIDVGGRDAVETAFAPTVEALRDATKHLLVPRSERGMLVIKLKADLPAGFHTARVEIATAELLRTLRTTARLARAVFRAVRFIIVPEVVTVNQPFEVTVDNFSPDRHRFVFSGPGNIVVRPALDPEDLGNGVWRLQFDEEGKAQRLADANTLEIRRLTRSGDLGRIEDHEWVRIDENE